MYFSSVLNLNILVWLVVSLVAVAFLHLLDLSRAALCVFRSSPSGCVGIVVCACNASFGREDIDALRKSILQDRAIVPVTV